MPAAYFAAINTQYSPAGVAQFSAVNDTVRGEILSFSRGLAFLLLFV